MGASFAGSKQLVLWLHSKVVEEKEDFGNHSKILEKTSAWLRTPGLLQRNLETIWLKEELMFQWTQYAAHFMLKGSMPEPQDAHHY